MKPLAISINELAWGIAVPPGRVSAIVNRKRGITGDTALRLAKYFGTSAEAWMGLPADYAVRVAARVVGPEVERSVRVRARCVWGRLRTGSRRSTSLRRKVRPQRLRATSARRP